MRLLWRAITRRSPLITASIALQNCNDAKWDAGTLSSMTSTATEASLPLCPVFIHFFCPFFLWFYFAFRFFFFFCVFYQCGNGGNSLSLFFAHKLFSFSVSPFVYLLRTFSRLFVSCLVGSQWAAGEPGGELPVPCPSQVSLASSAPAASDHYLECGWICPWWHGIASTWRLRPMASSLRRARPDCPDWWPRVSHSQLARPQCYADCCPDRVPPVSCVFSSIRIRRMHCVFVHADWVHL